MVTSVPTTAAILAAGLSGGLLIATAIVALIVLLIAKELGSAEVGGERRHPRLRFLVATLNAPILSLLAVFIVVVAVKVWEIL